MKNLDRIVEVAILMSDKSVCHHRLGAVIFKGKKIISVGYNRNMESRKKLHPRFMRWKNSIHAEVDSILSAKTNLKGHSILVVRVNNSGELKLAKPCHECEMYLDHVGIKRIYYSTNEGTIEEM